MQGQVNGGRVYEESLPMEITSPLRPWVGGLKKQRSPPGKNTVIPVMKEEDSVEIQYGDLIAS